ncbi:MAG: prephenate dehydrogenase [Agathobacter sp.]|nr:prephenate dehydrogenase [Agathobacter sp.]
MKFNNIGFIGLGLIGGSIAKKMKENQPDVHIIATAGHQETITEAHNMGLIANDTLLPLEAFSECDVIFLCAPVSRNVDYLRELKNIIKPDCYITDVGSTKGDIHEEVIALGLEKNFIGGHPMTGSEKTGITSASSSLLENAYYIITPTAQTPTEDVEQFHDFVKSLGSIPLVLDCGVHDYSTGAISHLPHMIAFSLVNLVKDIDDEKETMKTIAAGGFRDITRIASSSPVMWQNICFSNKEQLLRLMDLYIEQLSSLKHSIMDSDQQALLDYFASARDYRDSFFIPPKKHRTVFELYLDLDDKAGEIAIIATIFAKDNISIKNIGIINNREFEEGVLRVEFYDLDSMNLAREVLQAKNYTIYER